MKLKTVLCIKISIKFEVRIIFDKVSMMKFIFFDFFPDGLSSNFTSNYDSKGQFGENRDNKGHSGEKYDKRGNSVKIMAARGNLNFPAHRITPGHLIFF